MNETPKIKSEKSTSVAPKFRRRAEARPDEVLDAALDLFIKNGFAGTRVDEIATNAGISKGAVYLYFPSKQSLLEGLVRRAVVTVATGALEILARFEGDPREALTLALRLLAKRLADPRVTAIPRIIMREVTNFPELATMYRKEVLDLVLPSLKRLITKGVEGGHFRNVDPEMTIRSVAGPVLTHVLLAEIFGIMPEGALSMDRFIENHLTILFDGLSAPGVAAK